MIVNVDPSLTIVNIIVSKFVFSKTTVFSEIIVFFKDIRIKKVANRFYKNDRFQQ